MEEGLDQVCVLGRHFGCRRGSGFGSGWRLVLASETGPALQEVVCLPLPLYFSVPLLLPSKKRSLLALPVAIRIKAACENIHTNID